MILTVTLNPVLDKRYSFDNLASKGIHRPQSISVFPAGKGVNVSRVLHSLKVPTLATGILGGYTGQQIETQLTKRGVPADFVWIRKESRCGMRLIAAENRIQTRIIEPGPPITPGARNRLTQKLSRLTPKSNWVLFAGNPSPGTPASIFYHLIKSAQEQKAEIKVALHAGQPWLEEGLKAQPDLVVADWEEFQELVGPCYSTSQAMQKGEEIIERGLNTLVISIEEKGIIALQNNWAFLSQDLPQIAPCSPISGSEYVLAGLLGKLNAEENLRQALRFGLAVAASHGSLETPMLDQQETTVLMETISVEKISL